jgi:4-hydroxyphenylacetate 3-monooxygenase
MSTTVKGDKEAVGKPGAKAGAETRITRPQNGGEYLDSLRDDRTIFIYGERVKDVTTHPAFRNTARMVARLYDALHDPKHADKIMVPTDTGNGGKTHAFFKAPKSLADLLAGRSAIAEWAKITYGWLGRSPDYKASFLATLGANAEFYDPYQENARRWYKLSQERVPFVNHAIIHPPVDRDRPPNEVGDVCCHVEKETDAGIVVSHHGLIPVQDKKFAVVFMVPTNHPGVKFVCRTSYEMTSTVMGSPFDYPLSSRIDENDAVFILDKVLVPWENVFVYGDLEKANNFFPRTGFLPRFVVHGCTRLAVKLDFIAGLLLKAVEASGTKDYRGVQANVGEVIAWRNLFWALSDAMVRDPKPWIGDYVLPNMDPGNAYQIIATMAYTKVKYIIEQTVASGLIYLNSHARDFKNAEIRPYLDRYMRGSNGYKAEERVKLMKLLWDCLATEFGGRHELYEINYGGSTEEIRRYCLFGAQASGNADRFKGFAEDCMAEYDLDGWKVPDLTDPGELSYHVMRGAGR